MTFLAPGWLLLAVAAAIPVAIHLLRRRIGTRVELPTARYLARAEAEHSRELRLRNLALMLVRVAIVLLLALAAARPMLSLPFAARVPGALALVVDNSLSSAAVSEGRPVLDVLKDAARISLSRLGAEDRGWLITVDGVVIAGNAPELIARLDSLRPFPGSGDLQRALSLASDAVQGSALPGEVGLLTDGQATQWRDTVEVHGARVVVFAPGGEPPPNRAVVEARPEPLRWPGGSGAVNTAFLSLDSALFRVTVGGQTVLRGIAEPDGRVRAPFTTTSRGWFAGTVESERDELPLDDVRHFAAFSGPVPAVTLLSPSDTFAAAAVATLAQRGRLREGGGAEVGSADLARRLPALLTPPRDPVRRVAANRALERLGVPWRFGDVVLDTSGVRADSAEFAGLPPPRVFMRHRLIRTSTAAREAGDTLAVAGGEPWIVSGPGYVLLGSPLTPEHSTLPAAAAFIPWMERTLAHRLTSDAIGVVEATVGDTVRVPPWADGFEDEVGRTRAAAVYEAPSVRFLTRGGTRVGAVVVSAPRAESVLDRADPATLRSRIRGGTVTVHADAGDFDRALLRTRGRTEVTAWLLALVVAALVAEMILRGSLRRSARPSALTQ